MEKFAACGWVVVQMDEDGCLEGLVGTLSFVQKCAGVVQAMKKVKFNE